MLLKFYADLFGWRVGANNPMKHGIVDTGEKRGIPGGVGQPAAGARPLGLHLRLPGRVR